MSPLALLTALLAAAFLGSVLMERRGQPRRGLASGAGLALVGFVLGPTLLGVVTPGVVALFTPLAQRQLEAVLARQQPAAALRIFVKNPGGNPPQFDMALEPSGPLQAGDTLVDAGGLPVVVAAASLSAVEGATVDFRDDPLQPGFLVQSAPAPVQAAPPRLAVPAAFDASSPLATQVESVLGMKIRHYLPEDSHTVNSCINCGVSVMLESPSSAIAKAIASVAATLCEQTSGHNGAAAPSSNGRKSAVAERLKSFLGLSPALPHPI